MPSHPLAERLKTAKRVVAFTGAGISTESGIPDFRSPGGIWATSQPVYYDQFLASATARHEYWRQKSIAHRDFASSQPNIGHRLLAAWEKSGRLQAVITQNIDGLHQQAGSKMVWELHGTARQIGCLGCAARFDADPLVEQFLREETPPVCPHCGGLLKHATISFGQQLDTQVVNAAVKLSQQADLFLAIGSSLVVEPAATLPLLAKQHGAALVILNRDPTPHDHLADLVLHQGIGETLEQVEAVLRDLH
ncbi:SIR2 family NAD-dependent protein deacylase [Lignipirellula cremea]|uniref:protein acetyllysine N-acetyltransferase n=1 Tax=Lignipirellula cremea TaxID=2528010 RepID=A0A518DTU5_9BACT|nr:Sir2 family NAD-dependent protein deacetylase [Lignipirellula cremea]QDU95256.1 NAD-dependent protein deacetylase [Lignipirellula cremea]